jgi:hypothetical protein
VSIVASGPGDNGLTVDLLDARGCVAPSGWDAFVVDGRLSRNWTWPVVRAWAESGRGETVAALVTDGAMVVGLAAFRRRPAGVAQVVAPGTSALPGFAIAGDRDGELGCGPVDVELCGALLQALEGAIRRRYRAVAVVWYRQIYRNLLPAVLSEVALTHPGWPVAYFHNTFDDYDGYLASLSKSRRVDQRRLVRRIDEDPEVTVEWGPGHSGQATGQFHALVDETAERYRTRRFLPTPSLPRQVIDTLVGGPDSMVVRYYRDRLLIGAGLTVDHPSNPVASVWGALEPDAGGRNGLWFDQTARVLQWVIGEGRQGIVGGKGLVDLKCKLGYRAVPQWSVARRLSG